MVGPGEARHSGNKINLPTIGVVNAKVNPSGLLDISKHPGGLQCLCLEPYSDSLYSSFWLFCTGILERRNLHSLCIIILEKLTIVISVCFELSIVS